MQSYQEYVEALNELFDKGSQIPSGRNQPRKVYAPEADAPRVLLISPHPDDEVITGALPLRLLRQSGYRVVNLAVTLGSNKARQSARLEEVKQACDFIGFGLQVADDCGLERINLIQRREDPTHWLHAVDSIALAIRDHQPHAIFYPHASDANATHMGVHGLVNHALVRLGKEFSTTCVETEFWQPMDKPSLCVESTVEEVGDLVAALSLHQGEVVRNPYHLRLPMWMMDNVRRGAELVGGQGGTAPDMRFATLYRMRRWEEGRFQRKQPEPQFLPAGQDPAGLF